MLSTDWLRGKTGVTGEWDALRWNVGVIRGEWLELPGDSEPKQESQEWQKKLNGV